MKKGCNVNKASNAKKIFHCDECNQSWMSNHMLQRHVTLQNALKIKCEKCEVTFKEETEWQAPVEEKPGSCAQDSVCDECLNYWVQKSG